MTTLPQIQVLVDWVNNPIGASAIAGNNFTDISSYILLSQGITISRGRQDNISVVQPSRCTLTLFNDDGRFTPGLTSSPYYPGVILGRRVQVNVKDESGTYHTRFDGMISEIDIVDTPTGKDTGVTFACTDVLSFLNRYPAFSCWTVQECQFQAQPALQYIMNEPANSQGINDSSGNNGPLLTSATYTGLPFSPVTTGASTFYFSAPTITFQSGNNPVEGAVEPTIDNATNQPITSGVSSPLPSVAFTATANNPSGPSVSLVGPSAQFQGQLPSPMVVGTNNFTLLGWIWPDPSLVSEALFDYPMEVIALSNTRTGAMLSFEVTDVAGFMNYYLAYYTNFLTTSPTRTSHTTGFNIGSYPLENGPFMVALTVSGTTVTFYIGGNLFNFGNLLLTDTTITLPTGTIFNYLTIGGPIGGGNGWLGNISNVCLYNQALNSTQLTDIALYGAVGIMDQSSGTGFSRANISYTSLPSYWQGTVDQGLSLLDYVDITGAGPSTVTQNVQAVEHGLAFTDAKGKLNFHDRSRRMGAAAPSVTLPAGSYSVGIKPKINDQYLVNYEALQNERGGSGVVSQNTKSTAQYGVYPNGSIASPQTAPYTTWQASQAVRQFSTPGVDGGLLFLFDNTNIYDAGSWDVNTLGQPAMKLATLTVDMLGNMSGQNEYVAPSVLFGLEIDQPIAIGHNLPWWPNGPMSSELFIEGVNERYSTGEATIAFYTSPAFQARAWIPGSTAYGQLDVSARVGISIETGATGVLQKLMPAPAYSSGMNLGAGADGFIGARDQLAISKNLQTMITPPMLFVQQIQATQTFGLSGWVLFDTIAVDTAGGMNQTVDQPGMTYTIPIPGWYEICGTLNVGSSTSGTITVWIEQNQTFAIRQNAPAQCAQVSSGATGLATSAVMWCLPGDAIGLVVGGSLTTSIANGGSHMSIRYLGQGSNRN
jgi:hypothetical protein